MGCAPVEVTYSVATIHHRMMIAAPPMSPVSQAGSLMLSHWIARPLGGPPLVLGGAP